MRKRFVFLKVALPLLALVCQGCDVRGASHPFSYAPPSAHSVWVPSEKALRRLSTRVLTEMEIKEGLSSEERPLSLAEVIDIALYHNPDTKESWAEARAASAEYGQSLQNDFLLAEINADFNRMRFAEFLGSQRELIYETQYGAEVELSYLIFDFGQTRMTSEAALQALYNADWLHNDQVQQKIQSVILNYYDYLYQKKLLVSDKQDTLNAEVTLKATEEKFERGLADISDTVQAKTSYLQQKLTTVNQQQMVEASYAELVNTIGLPANQTLFFQDYPDQVKTFPMEKLNDLILQAHDNRPDLLAAEADVKSKMATLKASKAQRYPQVSGTFDIGRRYYQKGINDVYDFSATVSLSFPLFQGFYISNTIKESVANLETSRAQLEGVKLSIIQEVTTYRSAVVNASESLKYAKDYLVAAEEDYKVNLQRYRFGTGTIIDLINALTSVSDARSQLADSENTWYQSIANLAYAIGILMPPKTKNRINPSPVREASNDH